MGFKILLDDIPTMDYWELVFYLLAMAIFAMIIASIIGLVKHLKDRPKH